MSVKIVTILGTLLCSSYPIPKQQAELEITKFRVFWITWTTTANF